jgi:hypothetical protein
MSTAPPDTDSTATSPVPPSVPAPLPPAVAMVLAALSVVMIGGGGVVVLTGFTLSGFFPAGPGNPQVMPTWSPVSSPGPKVSTRAPEPSPTGPDALAALDEAEARARLRRQAAADAGQIVALAGSWVPQVSSKCAGLKVDIGPDWEPNGRAETGSVTTAQIAAFHTALHDRFGALTARPTTVGIERDKGTRGGCAGLQVWMSLVPKSFADPASANAWCDANNVPVHECGARLVAPGDKSRFVGRD